MTEAGSKAGGPLAGVRVVELAGIGPGPFAGMMLADLGAEVIRVDRPGAGSSALPPNAIDVLGRGKRSVVVNLKDPRGVDVVLGLAERSDLLLEGYRPGVTERLGIGPEACLARNPRLVYGRMTGWGQEGPLAQSAGHDISYIAITGALGAIGAAGGAPQIPVNYLGDFGGGSTILVVGLLSALVNARATGRGQVVDAAIVDGAALLQSMTYGLLAGGAWEDKRGVNLLDGGAPYYSVYPAADGRYLAVGALEVQFYAKLTELLFAPDGPPDGFPAQHDRSRWPEMRAAFAARFATRTQEEWAALFEGTDACVAPVLTMTEATTHPHLAARETYVTVDGVPQPAPAPRFAGTPAPPPGGVPQLGADTRDVLTELGFADVDKLLADGAVVQS